MKEYADVVSEIEEEFPKFNLVNKENSFLCKIINRFLILITFGKNTNFMTHYVTTIGNTVYVPKDWWFDWDEYRKISILRHERVHLRQQRRYTRPIFSLLYLFFPLPTVFAWFRLQFELEAYTETCMCMYEYGLNPLKKENRDWIVDQLTGSSYFWTFPFRNYVERHLVLRIRKENKKLFLKKETNKG